MQLNELGSPRGSRKRRKIVGRGRGSGHGKTSCRGEKGQNSRSTGRAVLIGSEGGQMPLMKRIPKVGFRSHRPILNQVVKLEGLNQFAAGTVINAELLKSRGLIQSLNKPFKILADGEITKSLVIGEGSVSKAAQEKIVQAGGRIEIPKENSHKGQDPSSETATKKIRPR